jgi:hypothetical protein
MSGLLEGEAVTSSSPASNTDWEGSDDAGRGPRHAVADTDRPRWQRLLYATYTSSSRPFRFVPFDSPFVCTAIVVGMMLLGCVAFGDGSEGGSLHGLWPIFSFSYFIFRERRGLQALFALASALHLAEAVYAIHVLHRLTDGRDSSRPNISTEWRVAWFLQTLAFGYPSLRALLALPHWYSLHPEQR